MPSLQPRPIIGPRPEIIVGKSQGRLVVVATPIGNLNDLSDRARQSLATADVIAAEDTRHTRTLLQAIGVSTPLVSLHEHNEAQRVPEMLERLAQGAVIVLVSDAGTPLLSDPGYDLVRQASQAGFDVVAIPGPSAITTALAVAGLPTDRFCFEGFLPAREKERRSQLASLASETRTLVFFEAPHRIVESLADLALVFGGERPAVVARELTKMHEAVYRGSLAELAERSQTEPNFQRGEITMVVQGAPAVAANTSVDMALLQRTVEVLVKELPPSKAAALAAKITGASRNEAYSLASRLSGGRGE